MGNKINTTTTYISLARENAIAAFDNFTSYHWDMEEYLLWAKTYNGYESLGSYLSALMYCHRTARIYIGKDNVLKIVKTAIEAHKSEKWMPDLIEEIRDEVKFITGEDIGK